MRIVLSGGGTTGHISPMLATAHALRNIEPASDIVCVGTSAGLETDLVPGSGFDLELVDPVPLPRRFSWDLVTLPFRLSKAIRQATGILKKFDADVVVGFGGYACLPVYLGARRAKIPIVVHEANAVAGLANRIGARRAARVCVSFTPTSLPRPVVTGMPIAADIATLDREVLRCQARQEFGLDQDAKVLLVSGGSQGAMSLNTAVWEAAQDLASAGVSILHITGAKNISKVPGTVGSSYVPVKYVSGMEKAYAAADMMLARSGAATVTETATVGLPTIYVPLPHGNGEQEKNARGIVDAGGGILVDDHELSAELLVDLVTQLISDPQRLASMGEIARQLIPRDSASLVALEIIDVVRGGG